MPASPPRQVTAPSSRTSTVLTAFCVGMALGILLTITIPYSIKQYSRSNTPGEGRNRADAVRMNGEGKHIVFASSCEIFRDFTEMHEASGPVRFRVELTRIVDGDTIRVIWHGENMPVRLLGIDAPERMQPGGKESTECLQQLLADTGVVDLEFENDTPRRDSLGRLLAYVWRGDTLINLEMVERRHAGLYKDGGKGKYGNALRHAARKHSE